MLLSTTHPRFDRALELLCLLPPSPHFVLVEDLRIDLVLEYQSRVLDLCDELLERHGIHVSIRPPKGFSQRAAKVAGDDWTMAEALAEAYFDSVYPIEPPANTPNLMGS